MIELLVATLFGCCVFAGLRSYRTVDPAIVDRIQLLVDERKDPREPRQAGLVRVLSMVGRRIPERSSETSDLVRAVQMSRYSATAVRGMEVFLASAGAAVGLLTGVAALIVAPLLAFLGYRIPRIVLSAQLRRKKDQIAEALPDAVDLLSVAAQAGLSVAMSLARICPRVPGALGREMRRALDEVELGVPRAAALQEMARRCGVSELDALVGVLNNAERFGIGVTGSLRTFAEEVRIHRRQAAQEHARRAPVKMLFPLVFLIMPAFILLTVVPMLLSAFGSLSL